MRKETIHLFTRILLYITHILFFIFVAEDMQEEFSPNSGVSISFWVSFTIIFVLYIVEPLLTIQKINDKKRFWRLSQILVLQGI